MKEEKLNTKLNREVEEIRKIKMTAEEKKHILENILRSTISPFSPLRSPFYFHSFFTVVEKHRLFSYIVLSCLVLTLGSTGAVYASFSSLPGNILYPLKVNIIEPAQATFISSLEEKAKYESSLAMMRLIEAEILAGRGELDMDKEKTLSVLLESHTTALEKNLEKIRQEKPTKERGEGTEEDEEEKIITNFHSGINAHTKILGIVYTPKNDNEKGEEVKLLTSAQASAIKIKNYSKNRNMEEEDEAKTLERYTKKKTAVQSIIDKTSSNLNNTTENKSSKRTRIIEDTGKTLEEAKKFLKEADDEDKKGKRKDAYLKLLDGESYAREADIFLQTGLKLE